ncbi:MAG: CBS domain-containing protein [Nitrospirae bacterium]|nr:CBS domain-containing protein [Nitrospirota bacterium]
MNRDICWVKADDTLTKVAESMLANRVGAVLVKQDGEYQGILSETDIVRRAVAAGLKPEATLAKTVMSSPLITIDINQTLTDANEIMSEKRIRHLVVTERGTVVGIISVRDLVIYFKNRI